MSYLAIARKYRPATFEEIVGQEHVTRTLRNAITSGRIHHAFLFCGARGVGKTTAARALAKSLNCEQGPTAEPCGVCTSCVETASGTSPDLIEIDGASNNSVDDVRDLRETVNYAPTRGRYKVYLVDEVHMLSKAAFNALLKTLEEPPPHVVFIFATTEPNRILDTILSRVQRFDFKRIGVPAIAARLADIAAKEGVTISDRAVRVIARGGEGSMRDAESLLDKVISFAEGGAIDDGQVAEILGLIDRTLLFRFLEGLVQGDPAACLQVVSTVYEYGHELSQFTADLLELVRNATFVRLSEAARAHVDVSDDELSRLTDVVEGVPPEALTRTFNALLDVHDQVSRAQRPRIVLEMAAARLATRRPVEPVAGLLARLEDLERRLRGSGAPVKRSGLRSERPAPRQVRAVVKPVIEARSEPSRHKGEGESDIEPGIAERPAAPPRPPDESESPAPPTARGSGFQTKWAALAEAWTALGHPVTRLAAGEATVRNGTLIIAIPAGRALAEGRRAHARPEVRGLLQKHFPRLQGLEVEPLAGTGTPEEHQQALRNEVLDDPEFKRIITSLGAELDAVTSLKDDAP